MMDKQYRFHCNGCKKPDKDYPVKFQDYEVGQEVYECPPVSMHRWARRDVYAIFTGLYCDECYNSNKYPYRKDYYHDPAYAGERMDEDY